MKIINYSLTSKVYLPAHVDTIDVFFVLLRIMGYSFFREGKFHSEYDENSTTPKEFRLPKISRLPFDENLASSEENYWNLSPVKQDNVTGRFSFSKSNKIIVKDPEHFIFHFTDLVGNTHQYDYFLGNSYDEYELELGQKVFYPSNSVIGQAIGKRLVDFFGGKMLYRECTSADDSSNWYYPEFVKYQPKNLTIDERHFLFINLLWNESIVTAQELIAMKPFVLVPGLFSDDSDDNLISKLQNL